MKMKLFYLPFTYFPPYLKFESKMLTLDPYNGDELSMMIIMCLSIWKYKNELAWNQPEMEVVELVESTKFILIS